MSEQNDIDRFMDWAKARLDEMAASARALEEKRGELEEKVRADAEAAVGQVNRWVADGEQQLKAVQEQGAAALDQARTQFEANWQEFQTQAGQWVELAENQRESFNARAEAQLKTWQGAVEQYTQKAAELHEQHRADAEAGLERLKEEAGKAQAQLDQLGKASAASWEAMSQGLDESRKSLDKAARDAWDAFNKAMKG